MIARLRRWLHTPMTVCAWCPRGTQTVIRWGNPFVPRSHGMCDDCAQAWRRSETVYKAMRQEVPR